MTDKRASFSRQVRLLKAEEFSRVFKNPLRSSDRYLTILAISRAAAEEHNSDLQNTRSGSSQIVLSANLSNQQITDLAVIDTEIVTARLGLAISKKNAKRAVDRNRIKRIIRESFRLNLQTLPPIDMVVMAKPVTKNADNQQIFYSLEQHWNKLRQKFMLNNQSAMASKKLQSRNLLK